MVYRNYLLDIFHFQEEIMINMSKTSDGNHEVKFQKMKYYGKQPLFDKGEKIALFIYNSSSY